MVGKRRNFVPPHYQNGDGGHHHDDIERGQRPLRKPGYRDSPSSDSGSEDQARREALKKELREGDGGRWDFEKYRKSDEELKGMKNKKARRFYEEQNARLDDWLEVDALVLALSDDVVDSFDPDADRDGVVERRGPLQGSGGAVEQFLPGEMRDRRAKDEKYAKWAININLLANILLLAAKIIAVFSTGSLSLLASTADSALDLLCVLIVYTTNKLVQWRLRILKRKFPVGRRRLEPLGILVFSIIMVVSFLQILQESVQKLLPSGEHSTATLPAVAIAAMAGNAVVKGLIGLGCMRIKTTQVQALAQDCKTDVYFNTASLLFPLIGHRLDIWWLDPVGAALLSLYIVYDWADTCLQNVSRLTGAAVPERLQQKLVFMAWRFSPVVDAYKALTAYHAGDGAWVEVDVLLAEETPLRRSHDVAETMQYCYEGLKEVDRAFVTVDYTPHGPTGHAAESG